MGKSYRYVLSLKLFCAAQNGTFQALSSKVDLKMFLYWKNGQGTTDIYIVKLGKCGPLKLTALWESSSSSKVQVTSLGHARVTP